ncbi:hypothetical protein IB274_20210 [Pseudomonas sp. PDM18]|uniref:hypothetical protein n=1 Tax=Pseudomonas sp. PDM18 TaxID=2769253 RepID=UPI00177CE7C6|nr:hypothetical protein [Pseudomonas sp. PDM18]MBD9679043.1 hypothetical protein [Pseudomonas sp. PDM18]
MKTVIPSILSITALIVSLISLRHTRRLSDSAYYSYRAQVSERHAKYRVEFNEIRRNNKEGIYKLSKLAEDSLNEITSHFDSFDLNKKEARHLRHLLRDCAELIYYSFKGQLDWKYAEDITNRLQGFRYVESEVSSQINYSGRENFRCHLMEQYRTNPNHRHELELTKDIYFCELIYSLINRTSSADRIRIMRIIQEKTELLRRTKKNLDVSLMNSIERIDEVLEECELDDFALNESPKLYTSIKKYDAMLKILNRLYLPKIKEEHYPLQSNYISMTVLTCAVLSMIQSFSSWGDK